MWVFFRSHSGIVSGKQALALAFFYITRMFTWLQVPQNPGWSGSHSISSCGPSSHQGLPTTQHRASVYVRLVHVITSLEQCPHPEPTGERHILNAPDKGFPGGPVAKTTVQGAIAGQGTKTLHAALHSQKNK